MRPVRYTGHNAAILTRHIQMHTGSEAAKYAEDCQRLARTLTSTTQSREKLRHNDDIPTPQFHSGSLVSLWVPPHRPGLSTKLSARYDDPFRVVEHSSADNYIIEHLTPSPDY